MSRWAFAIVMAAVLVTPAMAELYKWTDENGETHYSDTPPHDAKKDQPGDAGETMDVGEDDNDTARTDAVTAWAITPKRLVTTYHAVEGVERLEGVVAEGERVTLFVDKTDQEHNLALVGIVDEATRLDPIPVRTKGTYPGTEVVAMGYGKNNGPGSAPKVSSGLITSDRGPRDDERLYEVSTPGHTATPGGPIFNRQGEIVGVILSKVDVPGTDGKRTQKSANVNYAVKSQYLARWLDGGAELPDNQPNPVPIADLAKRVSGSIVKVVGY